MLCPSTFYRQSKVQKGYVTPPGNTAPEDQNLDESGAHQDIKLMSSCRIPLTGPTWILQTGFPHSSVDKESAFNARGPSSIPESGRSAGEGINPPTPVFLGFPCGSAGKESTCNAGVLGSIRGLGRAPGEGKGYPLQYSGLENPMDCVVRGVAKSRT